MEPMSMAPRGMRFAVSQRAVRASVLVSALVLISSQASAHIMPWRDGVSRQTGFGTCAKGSCSKRIDFGDNVPHVHLVEGGLERVVPCTGRKRMPSACSTGAVHR